MRIALRRRRGGRRLHVHDRHRRLVGGGAAARSSRAEADRPRRRLHRGDLEGPVLPHARDRGRRDHEPRARGDRHRAVGSALQARRTAAVEGRGRRAAEGARLHDRGRLAAPADRRAGRADARGQGAGLPRREAQGRQAARWPRTSRGFAPCARRSATRSRSWSTRTSASRSPRRSAARARSSRSASRGSRSRCRPRTSAATSSSRRTRRSRSPSANRSTHPAHFREYLERDACSIVQVDVARIGGITPWLKVAHLAETFNVAGLPALPDGTARLADGGGAECARGSSTSRSSTTSRRRGSRSPTVTRSRRRHPASASTGTSPRSTSAPSRGRRSRERALSAIAAPSSRTDRQATHAHTRLAHHSPASRTTTSSSPARNSSAARCIVDENVTVDGPRAARTQGRDARDPRRRAGAPLQPDHRLRHRATSRPASTCTSTTSRWARSTATTRSAPTRSRRSSWTLRRRSWASSRADGRVATRNYIGILSTVNCSATVVRGIADAFRGDALRRFPERRRRRRADARHRLRHGHARRGDEAPATHAGGYARHAELRRRARRRAGLRGEPDQRAARRREPARRPAAAHVQHPGHRRHGARRSRTAWR